MLLGLCTLLDLDCILYFVAFSAFRTFPKFVDFEAFTTFFPSISMSDIGSFTIFIYSVFPVLSPTFFVNFTSAFVCTCRELWDELSITILSVKSLSSKWFRVDRRSEVVLQSRGMQYL